jgi:DNA polymerase I
MTATATEAPAVPSWLTIYVSSEPWEIHVDWIEQIHNGRHLFGLDVETTGLDPFAEGFQIRTVQLATLDTAWVLRITSPQMREAVTEILLNPSLHFVTHGSFDPVVLRAAWGVDLTGRTIDSHLLSRLVVPGDEEDHGLKPLAEKWLAMPELAQAEKALHALFKAEALAKADLRPGHRRGDPWCELARAPKKLAGWGFANTDTAGPEFMAYAAMDAAACLRLAPALVKVLGTGRNLVEHEMWLADLAVEMRCRGIRVDAILATQRLEVAQAAIDRTEAQLKERTGVKSRSPKLVDWLVEHAVVFAEDERTVTGRPSLAAGHIDDVIEREMQAHGESEALDVLMIRRRLMLHTNDASILSSFLALSDARGRVHPDIKTLRARTARMSVTHPALQTLKKKGALRACLLADEGMSLISADFSQVELRVAAALSGDPVLSAPLVAGEDLHSDTARRIFGPDFTDAQRGVAKTINFASLYGGGAKTVAHQTRIPLANAREAVEKWTSTYPVLASMARSMAQRNEVVTPTGRVIPTDPRRPYATLNYVCQSTARDLLVIAVRRLCDQLGLRDSLLVLVHDEVIVQVPAHGAAQVADSTAEVMATTLYGVPITAEAEVLGERWGNLP